MPGICYRAIAFEGGYTSEAHFSRSFKARFGHPPSYMRAEASDNQHFCDETPETAAENSAEFANWIRELAK